MSLSWIWSLLGTTIQDTAPPLALRKRLGGGSREVSMIFPRKYMQSSMHTGKRLL